VRDGRTEPPAPPAAAARSDVSRRRRLTGAARARRTLAGIWFGLTAIKLARAIRPTIVHANDWNTMWAAIGVKLLVRARLVYDSHELWADRNGRWEWRPWLMAAEALFVRVADAVIASSSGHADVLAKRYRISPA
jgi:hypothetical protein